jgi:hypothetical protein
VLAARLSGRAGLASRLGATRNAAPFFLVADGLVVFAVFAIGVVVAIDAQADGSAGGTDATATAEVHGRGVAGASSGEDCSKKEGARANKKRSKVHLSIVHQVEVSRTRYSAYSRKREA